MDWRLVSLLSGRRLSVDGPLGGGRLVHGGGSGRLGVHRVGRSYGDWSRGWRCGDVDRVGVPLLVG